MKIYLDQSHIRENFMKFFTISAVLTIFYHSYIFIVNSSNLYNNGFINYLTQSIKFIAFYLSILPIKALSLIYPDGYVYINSMSVPFSKDLATFLIEQVIVIFFISLTLFSIYIILNWTKKLYRSFYLHKDLKKEFSKFSIAIGITASTYYVLFIILTTSIIRSFK